jgi:hypothetical protein
VLSLKRPKIAVVADEPASPGSFGWIWHLLERVMGVRFTAVTMDAITSADLSRYNVIVFPDGSGAGYASRLGKGGIDRLKGWVSRGGALVCLGNASEFATREDVALSTAKLVGEKGGSGSAGGDSAKAEELRPEAVPGAIFRTTLDLHHFLTLGFTRPTLPVLVDTRRFYKPSKDGANVARFDRAPLLVSGWEWPDTEAQLKDTAWLIDEPTGDGHVVMFAGDPNFRLFWRNTSRLFLNAVMLAPTLE